MGRRMHMEYVAFIAGVGITRQQREILISHLELTDTGCLIFTGPKFSTGYGSLGIGNKGRRRTEYAHRVAWVLAGRRLVDGMDLMHQCPGGDNKTCCNVFHLELGTHATHSKDRAMKLQTSRSRKGLPFGVCMSSGRYSCTVKLDGKQRYFGTYDTWQEASAIAFLHKNLRLFPAVDIV